MARQQQDAAAAAGAAAATAQPSSPPPSQAAAAAAPPPPRQQQQQQQRLATTMLVLALVALSGCGWRTGTQLRGDDASLSATTTGSNSRSSTSSISRATGGGGGGGGGFDGDAALPLLRSLQQQPDQCSNSGAGGGSAFFAGADAATAAPRMTSLGPTPLPPVWPPCDNNYPSGWKRTQCPAGCTPYYRADCRCVVKGTEYNVCPVCCNNSTGGLSQKFTLTMTVAGSCSTKGTGVVATKINQAIKALPRVGGKPPSNIKIVTKCKRKTTQQASLALKKISLSSSIKTYFKGAASVPVYDVTSDITYTGTNETTAVATLLWNKAGPCSKAFPELCSTFFLADNRTGCISDPSSTLASCESLGAGCPPCPPCDPCDSCCSPCDPCDSCCSPCDSCCRKCDPCNSCCPDHCQSPSPPPAGGGSDQEIMFLSRAYLFGEGAALYDDVYQSWDNDTRMCDGAWLGITCWPDDHPYGGRVREITLDASPISGRLPPSWANLTYVETISLNQTFLGGTLPPEWGALQNLKYLYLDNNKVTDYTGLGTSGLTGTLPPAWYNMTSLVDLHLRNNILKGTLPDGDWGKGLPKLRYLAIDNNPDLAGCLPDSWRARSPFEFMWIGPDNVVYRNVDFGAGSNNTLVTHSGPIRFTKLTSWCSVGDNRYFYPNPYFEDPCVIYQPDPNNNDCSDWLLDPDNPYTNGTYGTGP